MLTSFSNNFSFMTWVRSIDDNPQTIEIDITIYTPIKWFSREEKISITSQTGRQGYSSPINSNKNKLSDHFIFSLALPNII